MRSICIKRKQKVSFRGTFLISTICSKMRLNNTISIARVKVLDINGTSRTADSVRRRTAHAPKVTGTKYIFMRQDVCAWKPDSSAQHVFMVINFFSWDSRSCFKGCARLKTSVWLIISFSRAEFVRFITVCHADINSRSHVFPARLGRGQKWCFWGWNLEKHSDAGCVDSRRFWCFYLMILSRFQPQNESFLHRFLCPGDSPAAPDRRQVPHI